MSLRKLMSSNGYFMLNKTILKEVGIDEALILSCMIEADEIFEDEWFYQTAKTIEDLTTLSEFKQTKAMNNLINIGLLHKKVEGLPAKRYFKLDEKKLFELLGIQFSNNLKTTTLKTLNNKYITNKNITIKERQTVSQSYDDELKNGVVRFIQLLMNQSIRFTPSECNKIIGICEELQVNPMSSYNLSKYLRGETSLPLSKRMFLNRNTYEKMKLGDYNDKESNVKKDVKKELSKEQIELLEKYGGKNGARA